MVEMRGIEPLSFVFLSIYYVYKYSVINVFAMLTINQFTAENKKVGFKSAGFNRIQDPNPQRIQDRYQDQDWLKYI